MDDFYNKHYIRTRSDGAITDGWSDGPHSERAVTEDDILLNDKGGYQFRLIINGEPTEENPSLFDGMSDIPLYRWTGTEVVRRTEEELEADRAAARAAAEAAERERIANDPATLSMEMAVDHELRISMLEIGLTEGGEV